MYPEKGFCVRRFLANFWRHPVYMSKYKYRVILYAFPEVGHYVSHLATLADRCFCLALIMKQHMPFKLNPRKLEGADEVQFRTAFQALIKLADAVSG